MSKSTEKSGVNRGRKFHQVCDGARRVFLREGYAGANVDDIARAAAVSKATLYAYFPDKKLMFEEIFRTEIAAGGAGGCEQSANGADPVHGLTVKLERLVREAVHEDQSSLRRLILAEARRFPQLARDYHRRIARSPAARLAAWLEQPEIQNSLKIESTPAAAEQLWRLAAGALLERSALFGHGAVRDAMIRETCAAAAATFFRAYARPSATDAELR